MITIEEQMEGGATWTKLIHLNQQIITIVKQMEGGDHMDELDSFQSKQL
jgi:hypothetical protein